MDQIVEVVEKTEEIVELDEFQLEMVAGGCGSISVN
jgi:hypothetical protein